MITLKEAAQAVLDRWDSPRWEWDKQGPTADLMATLRAALEQPNHEQLAGRSTGKFWKDSNRIMCEVVCDVLAVLRARKLHWSSRTNQHTLKITKQDLMLL
jgi:hypothetical protein